MHCGRCDGYMVIDYFIDMQDDSDHLWLRAWRCVNCGEVVEPGILARRRAERYRAVHLIERVTRRAARMSEMLPVAI